MQTAVWQDTEKMVMKIETEGNAATRWGMHGATKSDTKQRMTSWSFCRELSSIINYISELYKKLYLWCFVFCGNLLKGPWEMILCIEKSPLGTILHSASLVRSWCRQGWRVWHQICPSGYICLMITISVRRPIWWWLFLTFFHFSSIGVKRNLLFYVYY